jgi:hypothetical protein
MIDNDSDFNPTAPPTTKQSSMNARTLLLAPPSISSHEETLRNVLSTHDRSTTDLQMLDRLSAGLVTLPDSTYDIVLILTDADGTRTESNKLLGRDSFEKIVRALKAGGKLQAQDGAFGQNVGGNEHREGILAGLVAEGNGMVKPIHSTSEAKRISCIGCWTTCTYTVDISTWRTSSSAEQASRGRVRGF